MTRAGPPLPGEPLASSRPPTAPSPAAGPCPQACQMPPHSPGRLSARRGRCALTLLLLGKPAVLQVTSPALLGAVGGGSGMLQTTNQPPVAACGRTVSVCRREYAPPTQITMLPRPPTHLCLRPLPTRSPALCRLSRGGEGRCGALRGGWAHVPLPLQGRRYPRLRQQLPALFLLRSAKSCPLGSPAPARPQVPHLTAAPRPPAPGQTAAATGAQLPGAHGSFPPFPNFPASPLCLLALPCVSAPRSRL